MSSQTAPTPESDQTVEKKIERLRELYADPPEVGRAALETLIGAMKAAGTHSDRTSRRTCRRTRPPPAGPDCARAKSRS